MTSSFAGGGVGLCVDVTEVLFANVDGIPCGYKPFLGPCCSNIWEPCLFEKFGEKIRGPEQFRLPQVPLINPSSLLGCQELAGGRATLPANPPAAWFQQATLAGFWTQNPVVLVRTQQRVRAPLWRETGSWSSPTSRRRGRGPTWPEAGAHAGGTAGAGTCGTSRPQRRRRWG